MTYQGPGEGPGRPGLPGRDTPRDDLDRAFGPDTASVGLPSTGQRVRRGTVVALAFVAVGIVLAVVLSTILGSIQSGVGGVFPQPGAALDRFRSALADVPGVRSVHDEETTRSALASYEVSSVVDAGADLSHGQQVDTVRAVSAAAAEADGNGVTVTAELRFGSLVIGVTSDVAATQDRLEVARSVAAIGGVAAVRCDWGAGAPSDEPGAQHVEVATVGRGVALAAIMDVARRETHAVFPGAEVSSRRPS